MRGDDALIHRVIGEIAKLFHYKGIDPPPLHAESNLYLEGGVDSVDMLELTALLDKEFGVHLLQEEMIKAQHVHEIADLVAAALKAHAYSTMKALSIEERPLTEEEKQEIVLNWNAIIDRQGVAKYTSRYVTGMAGFLFRSYWRLVVEGRENLPESGAYMLCANHASHLDNLALIFAGARPPHKYVFLAAKDYFFGKALKTRLLTSLMNVVPFDRSGSYLSFRRNFAYLDQAKNTGMVIVLFPEGTRSTSGKLNHFKPGAALFADHLKVKVVPAHIEGTYALLPKGKKVPKGGTIRVAFGQAMSLDNPYRDPEDPRRYDIYHHFMDQLKEEIIRLKPKR